MKRFIAFASFVSLAVLSCYSQDQASVERDEIIKLEKRLQEIPAGEFDWGLHNSLRHLYSSLDESKSYQHIDTIFRNSPFDDYTLMTIGAKKEDKKLVIANLISIAKKYPQYKHLVATCWIVAGKLAQSEQERSVYFQTALADKSLDERYSEHIQDFQWFRADRKREWPEIIPPPPGLQNRPGPWNDPSDLTIWPNIASRANSDDWIAQHHDEIRKMRPRLLLINFSNEHSREHIKQLSYQLIQALNECSRYHGYRDSKAPAFLDYQIFKYVDLRDSDRVTGDSRLIPNKTPGKKTPANFKYRSLFNEEFAAHYGVPDPADPSRFLRLDELLDGGYVHEVWYFSSASEKGEALVGGYEVVEEKPKYDNDFQKHPTEWVQAGNGGDDEQPWVGRSCRINSINCQRGIGCAMENLGHGLEGLSNSNAIPYFTEYFREFAGFDLKERFKLPVGSFYAIQVDRGNVYQSSELISFPAPNQIKFMHQGQEHFLQNYVAAGGNVHFPPNGRRHYDLQNTAPVLSTIEDWRIGSGPGGVDIAKPFTNRAFLQYSEMAPDCMGSWLIYWRQNMPGLDNKQKDKFGKPMKNWIPFLFY